MVTAQLEALQTLYNMCKISCLRQEAAAVAGIIPYLTTLASPPRAVPAASPSNDLQVPQPCPHHLLTSLQCE